MALEVVRAAVEHECRAARAQFIGLGAAPDDVDDGEAVLRRQPLDHAAERAARRCLDDGGRPRLTCPVDQRPGRQRVDEHRRCRIVRHVILDRPAERGRSRHVLRPGAIAAAGEAGDAPPQPAFGGQPLPDGDDAPRRLETGHDRQRLAHAVQPLDEHQVGWVDRRGQDGDQQFPGRWPRGWHLLLRHLDAARAVLMNAQRAHRRREIGHGRTLTLCLDVMRQRIADPAR